MKLKLNKKAKKILILIIALFIGLLIYLKTNIKNKLYDIGYNKSEVIVLIDKLSTKQLKNITNYEYLNYLSKLVSSKKFKSENLEKYVKYISKINDDYDINEVIYIINNDINYPYSKKLITIIHNKYFIKTRLKRYMNYQSDDYENIVSKVNSNRDFNYYENTKQTNISDNYSMIVNKYYYLDNNYMPSDLINVSLTYSYSGNSCRKYVLEAFIKMYNDAKKENIQLIINSSYRSYKSQETLWNDRKKNSGIEAADNYAARPGYSEHQTGLALDLDSYPPNNKNKTYDWLAKNAYKYGFILRYPKEKEDITGYKYEAWHYRYVGEEIAKIIFEENITLEEYYAFYIEKK